MNRPAVLLSLFLLGCPPAENQEPADIGMLTDVVDTADGARGPAADMRPDGDMRRDGGPANGIPDGCNPVAHEFGCLLPYPSDVFLRDGQLTIPDVAHPRDRNGEVARLPGFDGVDGFSVHPSILFDLGAGIDPASLVPLSAVDEADAGASTVLIDAETGTLVPHFSEVYRGADASLQIGAIRPLVRLENGRRYVAVVQGARFVDGTVAPAPDVFEQLRSGAVPDGLAELAARYENDVFSELTRAGIDRGAVQLAWDFTVRSEQNAAGDMFSVREETLRWLAENRPVVTITEVFEGDERTPDIRSNTHRHVEGTFTAPLFLEVDEPGAVLNGPAGARQVNGTVTVPFTLTIPRSLANAPGEPGRFIQFGHGFFGRRQEVTSFVQSQFGNQYGFVMGAIDWVGMSRQDREFVVSELTDGPTEALRFIPRVHQAMANQLVFTEVVREQLHELPELAVDSEPTYAPDEVYFFGVSQGHILGGTFMALTPTIDKAVLNVGGASIGFILTRSYAFLIFERLLSQWFDTRSLLEFESLMTTTMEVVDPITYAPYVRTRPLSGSRSHDVLLQGALGDAAVPNVALDLHARSIGLGLVTPAPTTRPAMAEVAAPAASGLTYVDFGIDPTYGSLWDPINMDTSAHEGLRRYGPARRQIDRFLRPDGMIEDVCEGPCVTP